MKLGTRIFFCYLLIFVVCFYYPINWIRDTLRTRYLEGVEDPLVDQANILAAIVGHEMASGRFDPEALYKAFQEVRGRKLSARIYKFLKTEVDMRVYITDASGKIIFDSEDPDLIKQDYSRWRDVRLTLAGEYGARTTLKDSADPTSSVLYVAAPVMAQGRIAGVLTVAKPTTNINTFLKRAKPQIFRIGFLAVLAAVLLSLIVSYWITRPIKRLTRYAKDIGAGKRAPLPKLGRSEIGEMGNAFEEMKEALEGKKYVEQYVQTLTHEIKSPLSAIRGAAELLEEKMRPEQRARFLANIHNEVNRIQDIVDRLLELAALENLKILKKQESLSFHTLTKSVLEGKRPIISQKQLTLVNRVPEDLMVKGDSFLLHQALSNLVQNAIDFSPPRRQIELSAQREGNAVHITVEDNGPGIPDYALEKVFDKFFSLERPDTQTKSTGLGLNFVKEVAMLHGGDITLANRPQGGVKATMTLPVGGGTLQKDKISLTKGYA